MNHAHLKKAETIGRINSCFKDVENVTTPVLTKEQFDAKIQEGTKFYENATVMNYITDLQKSLDSNPDKKDDILKSAQNDLGSLQKVMVVEKDSKTIVWIKKSEENTTENISE